MQHTDGAILSHPGTAHRGGVRRVVLVDDHRLFLDSLVHVIGHQPDLVVVGTAVDLAGARGQLRRRAPDVVVLDSHLPDGDAVASLGELSALAPAARIVVLTARQNPRLAREALSRGADAFVPKSAALGDVLAVLRGRPARRPSSGLLPTQVQPLSAREDEVLDLMALGLTNPDIAAELRLSTFTVRNHVASISCKLGAHSKLEAVSVAHRTGLLS